MARRRPSYRRRRPAANYVWQPFYTLVSKTNIGTGVSNFLLKDIVPGVPDDISGNTTDAFDFDVSLERIRGTCIHIASGATGIGNRILPVNIAAMVVPMAFKGSDDVSDLYTAKQGDDYPLFMSHFCDASSANAVEIKEEVDSKAKRKLPVGDILRFLASVNVPTAFGSGVDIDISLNLRLLWKLKV